MAYRKLEVTLHSADDLLDVREFGKMKVYAKVSISGYPYSEFVTRVDMDNRTSPNWNFKINYAIAEEAVKKEGVVFSIKLYCKRFFGDRYVGEVNIHLNELFARGSSREYVSYDVIRNDSEGTFGKLNISYNFEDTIVVIKERDAPLGRSLMRGIVLMLERALKAQRG